ncbi:MAG: hypothetical protein NT094_02425 [Candidatus Staskawiczbacteria bacterium]|nr:hypothetical protein [Candidatus Staskawiczbacteria bacterium]
MKGSAMILLSNGHEVKHVIASGAMGVDAKGYLWEKLQIRTGHIDLSLFTIVLKTLTRNMRKGYLRWYKPWECVKLIPGGSVNKVGLRNEGIESWCDRVGPYLDYRKLSLVASIAGDEQESAEMALMLNLFDFKAYEVNPFCPNTGKAFPTAEKVIRIVKAVKAVSPNKPIIIKVSEASEYLEIACGLEGIAEAISLNSVQFERVFPGEQSPLWRLEKEVGGGGGGVSGKPAQLQNWAAVRALTNQGCLPVIAPSIMRYEDIAYVTEVLKAGAVSFGAIHLPSYPVWQHPWTLFTNPCEPTRFVRKDMRHGHNC